MGKRVLGRFLIELPYIWQVRWSGIPISLRIFQFVVIHTVKDFGIVNRVEVDDFLELFCFFDDPTDCWQFDLWFL